MWEIRVIYFAGCVLLALPISHEPVNWASGSMLRILVLICPQTFDEDLRERVPLTIILPLMLPMISALAQSTLPFILPCWPTTTLPLHDRSPSSSPSIRISLLVVIVPTTLVPCAIMLCPIPEFIASFAIVILFLLLFFQMC